MGRVIQFEQSAVASLRERLGAVEIANQELIAFARGHSGAVHAIHEAVLAAIRANDVEAMLAVVTREWPAMLGIDVVTLALVVGGEGFRADTRGIGFIEPQLIDRAVAALDDVELRAVERGHALFGCDSTVVRAEALIRIDCGPGLPRGLLALGQFQAEQIEAGHGAGLLRFLGQSLAAMIAKWLMQTNS